MARTGRNLIDGDYEQTRRTDRAASKSSNYNRPAGLKDHSRETTTPTKQSPKRDASNPENWGPAPGSKPSRSSSSPNAANSAAFREASEKALQRQREAQQRQVEQEWLARQQDKLGSGAMPVKSENRGIYRDYTIPRNDDGGVKKPEIKSTGIYRDYVIPTGYVGGSRTSTDKQPLQGPQAPPRPEATADARSAFNHSRPRHLMGEVEFYEMTWEEYDKLDSRSKGAVDANTLLMNAQRSDKNLLGSLDADDDGRLTLREGSKDFGNDRAYDDAYSRVFENRSRDELDLLNLTYAPNTLAALNMLNIREPQSTLEQYLGDDMFISDGELKAGYHRADPVEKDPKLVDPDVLDTGRDTERSLTTPGLTRNEWITGISGNMTILSEALEQGAGILDGFNTPVSVTNAGGDRFSQFVTSLRNDMSRGASFDSIFTVSEDGAPVDRVSLAPLVDEDFAQNRANMERMYRIVTEDPQVTPEAIVDQQYLEGALKEVGVDWAEWRRFVEGLGSNSGLRRTALMTEEVSNSPAADPNAYQKMSAGVLPPADEDEEE